jgi:hypothetical protein
VFAMPSACRATVQVGVRTLGHMSFQASPSSTPTGPLKHEPSRSKLAILLDVRFQRRFAPLLVRWLYVGALVLIVAVTLFGLLMSWWLASWAGWGFWLGVPISITGGLVWGLGVRLVCEQLIRWTGPEPHPARPLTHSGGSSPWPSSHPPGSGPGPMGEGGAPHWKNDLHP